jgi:hypothetical protein
MDDNNTLYAELLVNKAKIQVTALNHQNEVHNPFYTKLHSIFVQLLKNDPLINNDQDKFIQFLKSQIPLIVSKYHKQFYDKQE